MAADVFALAARQLWKKTSKQRKSADDVVAGLLVLELQRRAGQFQGVDRDPRVEGDVDLRDRLVGRVSHPIFHIQIFRHSTI